MTDRIAKPLIEMGRSRILLGRKIKINQFSFEFCLWFLWDIQVRMPLDLQFRRGLRAGGRRWLVGK